MQKLRIDVTKIPREAIYQGQKGKYVTLIIKENRGGPDQYGWDGFAEIDVTKEEREAGVRGAIVGNWKHLGKPQVSKQQAFPKKEFGSGPKRQYTLPACKPAPPPDADLDSDESIPF